MHIDHITILIRVVVALVCGIMLGAEREYKGREAGLKTHMILSGACCLAIIVSAFGFSEVVTAGMISLDPSRIAAGVEGGIGFACAAVIWRSRSKVIGLTTAINTWATANIGMACGAGLFFAAGLITGLVLFVHLVVGPIERLLFRNRNSCSIAVTVQDGFNNVIEQVAATVIKSGVLLVSINAIHSDGGQTTMLEIEVSQVTNLGGFQLMDSLRTLNGVTGVSCTGACGSE